MGKRLSPACVADSGCPHHLPPYCRRLREPEGVKTSCWQRWRRRRLVAGRRLREAAQRLARGFGLWEGALYEIGGRTCTSRLPSGVSKCTLQAGEILGWG